uniref:Uncharacterized protein n=1 Tax=Rhizophagus irregularis (strain DAOM 181602 / DAOM 197198 / MUCL 43194) TaxID=747089 RepID=U9TP63_RHIID
MNLKTAGSSMHGLNGVSFFSFGSLASVLLALGLGYADMGLESKIESFQDFSYRRPI